MDKTCDNPKCCRHGSCVTSGHDGEHVMGHGFGSRCRKCGEVGVPLPARPQLDPLFIANREPTK
jgi:hypothetical protein